MTYHSYYNYYKNRLKSLKMNNYNFNILRYTFIKMSLDSGIEMDTLSKILGCSNIGVIFDRYIGVKQDNKLNQINKLSFNN